MGVSKWASPNIGMAGMYHHTQLEGTCVYLGPSGVAQGCTPLVTSMAFFLRGLRDRQMVLKPD